MLTSLSQQEREVISFYNERIRSGDTIDNSLWADGFTHGMFLGHPDGPVVDIGCGIGRAIDALEDYGVRDYVGIDPSEASIAYCQDTFPSREFLLSEVRLLGEQFPGRFGGFLLLNVLMHTPEADLDEVLDSLRKSLLLGARGFLNANKPEAAKYISDAAKGFTMSHYGPKGLIDAFERHGFQVENFRDQGDSFLMIVSAI